EQRMWTSEGRAAAGAYQSVSGGVFSLRVLSHATYCRGLASAVCQFATITISPPAAGFSSSGWIVTGWPAPVGTYVFANAAGAESGTLVPPRAASEGNSASVSISAGNGTCGPVNPSPLMTPARARPSRFLISNRIIRPAPQHLRLLRGKEYTNCGDQTQRSCSPYRLRQVSGCPGTPAAPSPRPTGGSQSGRQERSPLTQQGRARKAA